MTPDPISPQELRQWLASQGYEFTPQEVSDSLAKARERIRPGPDGKCVQCHGGVDDLRSDGHPRDFRFGLCDECAFPEDFPEVTT